jgi:hypothetical protein
VEEFDNPNESGLTSKIEAALLKGNYVLLHNADNLTGPPQGFNMETAERYHHYQSDTIDVHGKFSFPLYSGSSVTNELDAAARARNPKTDDGLKRCTLAEFFERTSDPNYCYNWLDSVGFHGQTPWSILKIDANSQFLSGRHANHLIRSDQLSLHEWLLWAHAKALTWPHRDADGTCTYVQIVNEGGLKGWLFEVPSSNAASHARACDGGVIGKSGDVYYIILRYGSIL